MKKFRFTSPNSVREASAQLLYLVLQEKKGNQLSLHLQQVSGFGFSAFEKNTITAIVYGVMTKFYSLEFILQKHSKRAVETLAPWLHIVLLQALWELRWSSNPSPAAICDETCKLVGKYLHTGAVAYANALLRSEIREPVLLNPKNLAHWYSLPTELAGLFKKWFGFEGAKEQLTALERRPDLMIRTNTKRISPPQLKKRLEEEGVFVMPAHFMPQAWRLILQGQSLTQLPSFQEGLFFVQGEAAMLPVYLVQNELADFKSVIDVCAAPGGKTSQMAEFLPAEARCVAQDSVAERLRKVEENFLRLDLPQPELRLADGAFDAYPETWKNAFDLALVDVPCSGLGLIGRKPDIRLNMTYERIQNLLPIQLAILQKAAALVREGGYLVYATCTLNPAENEEQVQHFLNSPLGLNFETLSLENRLPAALQDRLVFSQIEEVKRGCLTLLPANCSCEGFFVALLQRKN